MDDADRRTWTTVFFTLGLAMAAAWVLRLLVWLDDEADPPAPDALWTIGSLALAFLLASLTLVGQVWRHDNEAERAARQDEL